MGNENRNCRWAIERNKEGSARVALWRQLGLQRAYTMECTYSGFQQGPYKGYQAGHYFKDLDTSFIFEISEINSCRS